jgi:hypothetical protein
MFGDRALILHEISDLTHVALQHALCATCVSLQLVQSLRNVTSHLLVPLAV